MGAPQSVRQPVVILRSFPTGALQQVFHDSLAGAPEWQVAWSPRPARGVAARNRGRECSRPWGECQVGGGGNSNQIRHTTLDHAESRGGESGGQKETGKI